MTVPANAVLIGRCVGAIDDKDGLIDRMDDVVCDFVSPFVSSAIASVTGKKAVKHAPVMVSVDLQRWQNDYAVCVDTIHFDAAPALDELSEDGIDFTYFPRPNDLDDGDDDDDENCVESPSDAIASGAFNFGDDIFETAAFIGLIDDWDGPFDLSLDSDDEYNSYIRNCAKELGSKE